MHTDFQRLEQNIIEVIKEEQIKLGYRKEVIRLYYPLQSLNRFLKSDFSEQEMCTLLKEHYENSKDKCEDKNETENPDGNKTENHDRIVNMEVSSKKERFCFKIAEQTVEYVHEHMAKDEFIQEFIALIGKHDCTIEELHLAFLRYSDHVHYEKISHGEFDYLIYFEDGQPDDFRYCITDEGCHMIYHRFTPEDFQDFL